MQQSREGLTQTILYQSLSLVSELIPLVVPRRWAFYHFLGSDIDAQPLDWTLDELQESFERLAVLNHKSVKLFFLIDGLDEFTGSHDELVRWIRDVVAHHQVKLCLQSAVDMFSDAFEQEPSLTMQDLTKLDISEYINSKFSQSPAFRDLRSVFPTQAENLLAEIQNKAQGVFLWVALVVKSLVQMLVDEPSLLSLQNTLATLPEDIMDLYDRKATGYFEAFTDPYEV
jgi:hypothetical protein